MQWQTLWWITIKPNEEKAILKKFEEWAELNDILLDDKLGILYSSHNPLPRYLSGEWVLTDWSTGLTTRVSAIGDER